MRLGQKQLETLAALGSPGMAMVVPDKVTLSLVKHGLLRVTESNSFACITPAGLRRLADELEAGHIEGAHEWAARERAKNQARIARGELADWRNRSTN